MTDGPYDNSIRSNSSSGLGGIFAQLQAIANGLAALPQLADDVAAIRVRLDTDLPVLITRLTYLTGVTAPASNFGGFGLPGYLGVVLGSRAVASGEDRTVWQWLYDNDMNVGRILTALAGFPTDIAAGQNQLRRAADLLSGLSLVTGDINGDPNGSTLKDLMRSIDANVLRSAECCEEGQGGTTFPPPTGNCGNEQTTWTECQLQLRFSEVEGNDVYAVVFPASITSVETFVGVESAYDGAAFDPGLVPQIQAPGNALGLTACIAWNFGALSELVDYAVGAPFYDNEVPFNSYTSTTEPPLQEGVQLFAYTPRTDAGVIRVLQANFAFPNGVTPVGKVYVGLPTAP